MTPRLQNRRGMTLIELLIVAAMISISVGALNVVARVQRETAVARFKGDLQEQETRLVEALARDLARAESVAFPRGDGAPLMALRIAGRALGEKRVDVEYRLEGDRLLRRVRPGETAGGAWREQTLARDVERLRFHFAAPMLRVEMHVSRAPGARHFESAVSVRFHVSENRLKEAAS